MAKGSKTTTKPVYSNQLLSAHKTLANTVNANQPNLNEIAGTLRGGIPGLASKAFGTDPLAADAMQYGRDVLGGKYLTGNPHLGAMIEQTRDNVATDINSRFGMAGRTGGSDHVEDLSKGLAQAELGLRYQNYGDERQAQQAAAALVPGLVGSQYQGIGALTNLAGTAAEVPFTGAKALAAGTAGLLGPYTSTTQSQGTGSTLMNLAGLGLAGASLFSDERLKEDIKKVGKTDDGLNVFTYRYKGEPTTHMGVMAQEVAKKKPKALGEKIGGFMTVNYGEL